MTTRLTNFVRWVLIALPLLNLLLALLAWLRYGLDMPWYDDWRGYADGSIASLELDHLFHPVNDTLSPIGFGLDALAQRYLDGNSIAYQFLSMLVVLGSLLLLQWRLLLRALGDPFHAAVCFSFIVLMLQPGSYWGQENLAYYQALPLVFILGAMDILTMPAPVRAWRGPVAALLGLLAGFTYISGAFAAFAAGAAFLLVVASCHPRGTRWASLRDGLWFTVASAIGVASQFYFSILKFQGTHAGIPLALPSQAEFWAFYMGKLARSLLLPPDLPRTSLAVALVAMGVALGAAVMIARRAMSARGTLQDRRMAEIYVPVVAVVFVYLMLVAAGRTNFRPPEMEQLLEIFAYAFSRFHFFWAALLWPWAVAALIVLCRQAPWFDRGIVKAGGVLSVLALAGLMFEGGAYGHMLVQREFSGVRESVAHCLLNELQKGAEVRCYGLLPSRYKDRAPNAYPAYAYAKKTGASFVRYFPLLPAGRRSEALSSFFRINPRTALPRLFEMRALGEGRFEATGNDPQIYIQTNQPQVTRSCSTIDVDVEMKVQARDTAQLYFARAGESEDYLEATSISLTVGADGGALQTLSFRMESESGFFESMRFDPVTKPQLLEIREIRVYCVRPIAG